MNEDKKSKIKKTLLQTKDRRSSMTCKVIECKVDTSSLSKTTKDALHNLFLEGKWLYNAILASEDIAKFNTKVNEVSVKVLDKFENRNLNNISSQMKQGIQTRILSAMSTLKALKSKGIKIGKLKFKSEVNCIPLKQHNNTFTILKSSKRIKIQGIKKPLKVSGLNQLPKVYEVANANLVKIGKDYYVKITLFVTKEVLNPPNQSIGIDFGCTTQLTLSNGEKIKYQVPISDRVKKLDQAFARSKKGSKNRYKILAKREKAYNSLSNKRKEAKNQIVSKLVKNYKTIIFQDESLEAWKKDGHGKKIQFSAIGGIISALQRKAVTPIVVEKYYPSTQLCSRCGNKQKMEEEVRTYICQSCDCKIDRDINSAINIQVEGLKQLVPRESREVKPVEIVTSAMGLLPNPLQVQSAKQEAHEFIRG